MAAGIMNYGVKPFQLIIIICIASQFSCDHTLAINKVLPCVSEIHIPALHLNYFSCNIAFSKFKYSLTKFSSHDSPR